MELQDLEDIVDNMILQHNYPGFEPRALKLALPHAFNEAPSKLYLQALDSQSIYVVLAALRWFQTRSGIAKSHLSSIAAHLENKDPWVRLEAVRTMEIARISEFDLILKISELLKDPDQLVRIEAAKALGHLVVHAKKTRATKSAANAQKPTKDIEALETAAIAALKEASSDSVQDVRRKAIKSLRKLGAFSA